MIFRTVSLPIIVCAVLLLTFVMLHKNDDTIGVQEQQQQEQQHLIHIALSSDAKQFRAMLACINSTISNSTPDTRNRLTFHLFCTTTTPTKTTISQQQRDRYSECDLLRRYGAKAMPQLFVGSSRSLDIVEFDGDVVASRFARSSASNSVARNLSVPHNYVRFYLAELLPTSVTKCIWLDNDVLVLRDVAPLFDGSLQSDRFALASVVKRRKFDDSMLRRIIFGLQVCLIWFSRHFDVLSGGF